MSISKRDKNELLRDVRDHHVDSWMWSPSSPAMISKHQMKPMPMNNLVYVKNLDQDDMNVKNADFNMALISSTIY